MSSSYVVLLAPNDPVIGGLMGELVRLAGHIPKFANVDETTRHALDRVKPQLLLLDCDHRDCDEALLEAAKGRGTPIIFFSGARSGHELERFARRHGVHAFLLPNGPRILRATIERAVGD